MAQAKTPGTNTNVRAYDSNQLPTNPTVDAVPSPQNRMNDGIEILEISDATTTLDSYTLSLASTDFVYEFTAKDKGRIMGIHYANGAADIDSQVGWELSFVNDIDASVCAYFGFGGGTEAVKATDTVAAVDSDASVYLANSITTAASHFNRGDTIRVTADRDGTTSVGTFELHVSYEAQGRA